MSLTKRYIEEQLESGVDILNPEYLDNQLEASYEYYLATNEKRKKKSITG